jgi:hypothetical protein
MLADKQFEKPRTVAAAHLGKHPSGMAIPTVILQQKEGVKLIDQILS